MLLIMVIAVVLKIGLVFSRPSEGAAINLRHKYSFSEYDIMPDFGQMSELEHTSDTRETRKHPVYLSGKGTHFSDDDHKNYTMEEEDVFQREDHVTQHLSEMLVNTDSEITGLQASEVEETKEESTVPKGDAYFSFLTGQEKDVQVEWLLAGPERKSILTNNDLFN